MEGYWAIVDNVSHTMGNHNIKFGFEIRRPYFSGASYSGERGSVSFGTSSINAFNGATALESFLMGVPSTGSILVGDPTVVVRSYNFGIFVQDDWRLTPRLTLNLGLRYEYETPLSEHNNKLAQFDPNLGLVQVGTNGLDSPWKTHVFGPNLQPRLGVVYDVTGKGTTVVRAAFGIYSNWPVWQVPVNVAALGSNPTAATFVSATGVPTQGTGTIGSANVTFPTTNCPTPTTPGCFGQTAPVPKLTWTPAGPVFPTGTLRCGDGIGTNPGTCAIGTIDQHWKLPYDKEWTLGIQRSLTSAMALDVAYVGNHAQNLLGATDLNTPTLGTTDKAREQTSRPFYNKFPWMGKITDISNRAFSNYNALQATLTQRNWHGLTTTVGYTYGHALDFTQTDITQNIYPSPLCPSCDYGPTGFDVRHRVTVRSIYLVPGKKSFGQLLEGWQLSTLVNMIGALPYNGADGTNDLSGTGEGVATISGTSGGDRWSLFGDSNDFDGFGRFISIPCYGVTGSKFATKPCTIVGSVNAMPQACVDAANSLPTNPSVPSSDGKSTGLKSLASLGCYVSGNSVIVPPAQGTVGNMARNMFRGTGLRLWDFSVRKTTKIGERVTTEFQFDLYNVTNTPQFASPSATGNLMAPSSFGTSTATPNVANGNVVQGTGDARRYQFGLKFVF